MKKTTGNDPEALLKQLRKLPENKICPNCGTASEFGFGSVCVKYNYFVCDLCKTSHQAISHRVKSITMSTWTIEEVRQLEDHHGGGNAACRHVWLANAPGFGGKYPGGSRPKAGDKVETFKQFVIDCYEHGKFRATSPYQGTNGNDSGSATPVSRSSSASTTQNIRTNGENSPGLVTAPAPMRVPAAKVEADLLGFGFDNMNLSTPPAVTPPPPPQNTSSFGFDNDFFGSVSSVPTPPPAVSTLSSDPFSLQLPQSQSFGGFDEFHSTPQSSPFGASANASTSSGIFDAFGSASPTLTAAPAPAFSQQSNSMHPPSFDVFGSSPIPLLAPQPSQQATLGSGFPARGQSNLMSGNSSPSPMLSIPMPNQQQLSNSAAAGYRSGPAVMSSNVNNSFAISSMSIMNAPGTQQQRPMGGGVGMGMNGGVGMGMTSGFGVGMGGPARGPMSGGPMSGGPMSGGMSPGLSAGMRPSSGMMMSGASLSGVGYGAGTSNSMGGRPNGGAVDSFSFVSTAMQQQLGGTSPASNNTSNNSSNTQRW